MQCQVVLVIGLRRIECLQRAELGHDRLPVDFRGIELGYVGLRHLLLLVIGGEDRRPVLRAAVGALAVQLGRVVHHREEDLQDLAVADLLRVVFDLDRFRVPRGSHRNHVVVGGRLAAAGITGHGIDHARGVLEHALNAPEATAGNDRGLDIAGRCHVGGGRRDDHGFLRGARGRDGKRGNGQRANGGGAQRKTAEMARGHGFLIGAVGRQFRAGAAFRNRLRSPRYPKIRACSGFVTARATRVRE